MSAKYEAMTRILRTPETGAGRAIYPGVGVGNGIAILGAKIAIGPSLAAFTGAIQLGTNRIVKRKSVSSTRFLTVHPSMFSSSEAFKTIEANFDKVFRRTEQCTVILMRLYGLTATLQRYYALSWSIITLQLLQCSD